MNKCVWKWTEKNIWKIWLIYAQKPDYTFLLITFVTVDCSWRKMKVFSAINYFLPLTLHLLVCITIVNLIIFITASSIAFSPCIYCSSLIPLSWSLQSSLIWLSRQFPFFKKHLWVLFPLSSLEASIQGYIWLLLRVKQTAQVWILALPLTMWPWTSNYTV